MKSTRSRILQTLLSKPHSTINDLAEAVGINAISVRHHLSSLQADGLVIADEERHGVGRPRLVYSLTEKGVEQFPSKYLQLTDRLFSKLKEQLPTLKISSLLSEIATEISEGYKQDVSKLSIEERLEHLKNALMNEGLSIEWEKKGNEYFIYNNSCPYHHISKKHPEVCTFDRSLISAILAKPVKQINSISAGSTHCTYVIDNTQ